MLLVIIVESSASYEIFASWFFDKYMPLQFLFWHILRANNSTPRINKEGLSGQPWQTPLDISNSLS